MNKYIRFSLMFLLCLMSLSGQLHAQVAKSLERDEAQVEQFGSDLSALEKRFSDNKDNENVLIEIRAEADELLPPVTDMLSQFSLEINGNIERLKALGDPPADGEKPEADAITLERDNLNEINAFLTVLVGRLEAIAAGTEDLIFEVGIVRRDMFTNALFKRVSLNSISLTEVSNSFNIELEKFSRKTHAWLSFVWEFKKKGVFISLGLSVMLGIVIFWGGYRFLGRFIHKYGDQPEPEYSTRLTSAFWSAVIPTVAVAAFGASTYFFLIDYGVLRIDFVPLFARLMQSIIALVLVLKLARLILAPDQSAWRLVKITDKSARTIFVLVCVTFTIKSLSYIGVGIREILDLPLQNSVLQAFVETSLIAILLVIASRLKPVVSGDATAHDDGLPLPTWIRLPLLFSGLGLILIGLLGYVALASFIASQIVVTGALLVVIYFGLLSAKSTMQENAFSSSSVGQFLSRNFGAGEGMLNHLGLFFGVLTYAVVIGLGASFLLLQWGFHSQEVLSGVRQFLTQFQVGGITISFVNIGIGLALFAVGYFVTRRFQMWLDGNVLGRGKVEVGVRNSIRKVIGYFGIAIAAMIAVSAAGFDLSSLAFVAGALSLGIGFGLQTIVSNFVSGLILLAERPFKAGDWVETTSVTGIVKEISVRATEIETFSRKSVIVPNSELVNAAVGNWTHRNTIGRVEVLVGVSYDNSPQRIIDLLVEIANENPKILSIPEPNVEFVDFGASSLDFRIRGFLADIGNGLTVRNELRVAIYERFKVEGIEIPFPQQDVYLRKIDGAE